MTATASHYTDARPGNGAERSGPSAGRGGRQPPHNLAAERSLLGSMLLSPAAIGDALQRLDASDFYQPAHSHVFDAIAGLYAAGSPVDSVLVADQLTRNSLLDTLAMYGIWRAGGVFAPINFNFRGSARSSSCRARPPPSPTPPTTPRWWRRTPCCGA